jgi:UDP-3-O-[3-hydroxymyristoyl] glucosamine N-acyltransferase
MNNILVNNDIIFDALGIYVQEPFECYAIGHVGFNRHDFNKMLVFCESDQYLDEISRGPINAVICKSILEEKIWGLGKIAIISEDPKNDFQKLRDYLAKINYKKYPSEIDASVNIPPSVNISEYNVIIGKNVVIQPNVTILSDVSLGEGCFIGSGTVLGTAFDAKISKLGNISKNFHDGRLILGDRVEIHSGCVLDKGNSFHGDTIISNDCKISHQTYIGHSTSIGERTFVMARVAVAGAVKIGKLVTIHPGVCVCSHVEIGDYAKISTGSVVAFDVKPHARMSGNFAISHENFMEKYRIDSTS